MKGSFLIYQQSRIRYYSFGEGPTLQICFHGYGESGKMFAFLKEMADEAFTYIAIDLPWHGETEWNEKGPFTAKICREIIDAIIQQQFPENIFNKAYRLIGYSLGARIALSLFEDHPRQFEKLVLLAPDGLKINFWYWLATQTLIGNSLFKFTTRHSGWFMAFLKIANRFGLVNASIYKFTFHYIKDRKSRELLYQRWIGLRRFRPDLTIIKQHISSQKTPVRLVYGKHDRIIVPARGQQFQKGIEPYCSITIIDSGHQVLHPRNIHAITDAIQK